MRLLTIRTASYERELKTFVKEAAAAGLLTVRSEGWYDGLFGANFLYEPVVDGMTDEFTFLLENIVVQENPVYKHSIKLQRLAVDLRQTSIHIFNRERLTQFIKHSRLLHLEGYVAFRMTEYRHKLDMITYSLIRRMVNTDR